MRLLQTPGAGIAGMPPPHTPTPPVRSAARCARTWIAKPRILAAPPRPPPRARRQRPQTSAAPAPRAARGPRPAAPAPCPGAARAASGRVVRHPAAPAARAGGRGPLRRPAGASPRAASRLTRTAGRRGRAWRALAWPSRVGSDRETPKRQCAVLIARSDARQPIDLPGPHIRRAAARAAARAVRARAPGLPAAQQRGRATFRGPTLRPYPGFGPPSDTPDRRAPQAHPRGPGAPPARQAVAAMAPRLPIPLREVVYTLSPYQQQVMMQGIEKLPGKALKFVKRVRRGPGARRGGRAARQRRGAPRARGRFLRPARAAPRRCSAARVLAPRARASPPRPHPHTPSERRGLRHHERGAVRADLVSGGGVGGAAGAQRGRGEGPCQHAPAGPGHGAAAAASPPPPSRTQRRACLSAAVPDSGSCSCRAARHPLA
jgi:hypothetical protein